MPTADLRGIVWRSLLRLGIRPRGQLKSITIEKAQRPPVLTRYQLDRLRLLSARSRAYSERDSLNPLLARLGLARPTKKFDPIRNRRVWEITEAGRSFLERQPNA